MTYRVYVCGGTVAVRRTIGECHGRCQRRRRLIVEYDASPYYAPTTTCVACGDAWAYGELLERPFKPRWRDEVTARARELWKISSSAPVERDDAHYVIPR